MKKLPSLYQNYLQQYFSPLEYLMLSILLMLLQKHRWVRLEKLAENFPSPIHQRSRIKKLQRFLSRPQWDVAKLWFPIFKAWLEQTFDPDEVLYIAVDRSQWGNVNLFMISLIYQKRAIPIDFTLLGKLGNTSADEQTVLLSRVLELLKDYQKGVIGDREFCSVDLAKWLESQPNTYFSLRLKKNTCVQQEEKIWQPLQTLGIRPGISAYYRGVKVTKSKGFAPVNIAAKWKRTYGGISVDEAWFVLTNLPDIESSLSAYARRMGIEEMFRDFKSGGYNLEGTQVRGQRLSALILLMTLAYCYSLFSGSALLNKGIAKYVARPTERKQKYRQHSHFYLGLQGGVWLDSLADFADEVELMMSFSPQSRHHYQKGLRAISLLQSVF